MKIYKKYLPWSWFFFWLLFGILTTTTIIFTLIPWYKIFPQMPSSSWSGGVFSFDDSKAAFEELYHLISIQYYDTWSINQTKMLQQAMSSFVDTLWDPFSSYLPPDESKELNDSIHWDETIEWIWAVLSKKDSWILVEEVLKWSPAAQSDIKPLDVIIKVNGSWLQSLSIWEVVQKIRGKKGTQVVLTIARQSSGMVDIIEKNVVRDTILIPSVSSKIFSGSIKGYNIWYIALSVFAQDTDERLQNEISRLMQQWISWLILDLRWNGWWLLPESVDVASHFLPIWTDIVKVKYRLYTDSTYKAEWNDTLSNIPLVILVDWFTASASEIITLGIKEWRCKNIVQWTWWIQTTSLTDQCNVLIVWETTFWKWSIQNLQELTFWWSLKLTVGKWFAPSGISIDHIGKSPDIIVPFDKERYQKNGFDNQLEKAKTILSQYR